MKQLVQLLLQLSKIAGSNQAFLGLVQTVSDQLDQLVLDKTQHPVGQREGAVWRVVGDNFQQAVLHLGCGLKGGQAYKQTLKTLKALVIMIFILNSTKCPFYYCGWIHMVDDHYQWLNNYFATCWDLCLYYTWFWNKKFCYGGKTKNWLHCE